MLKIEETKDFTILKECMDAIYRIDNREKGVFDIGSKYFAYIVKNEYNEPLGGICGRRVFDEIYIEKICIDKSIRGNGIGRKLIETVEKEVDNGKCENINLITNEYRRAVGFYKKCGFKIEFIRKHKNNTKFTKYYMVKKLR